MRLPLENVAQKCHCRHMQRSSVHKYIYIYMHVFILVCMCVHCIGAHCSLISIYNEIAAVCHIVCCLLCCVWALPLRLCCCVSVFLAAHCCRTPHIHFMLPAIFATIFRISTIRFLFFPFLQKHFLFDCFCRCFFFSNRALASFPLQQSRNECFVAGMCVCAREKVLMKK